LKSFPGLVRKSSFMVAVVKFFVRKIRSFFGAVDRALFFITCWISVNPVRETSLSEQDELVDGGNLFLTRLESGLEPKLRHSSVQKIRGDEALAGGIAPGHDVSTKGTCSGPHDLPQKPSDAARFPTFRAAQKATKDGRGPSLDKHPVVDGRSSPAAHGARPKHARTPTRKVWRQHRFRRVDADAVDDAYPRNKEPAAPSETFSRTDTKQWIREIRDIYASRISFPRHKYEVFRPSQLNFVVITLWGLIFVAVALVIAVIIYTRAVNSDYFLYSTTFLYVATIGSMTESAISLLLYLFFYARVALVPARERTRIQYVIAAMTLVLFWQTEPLTALLRLADKGRLTTRVPRVVVAFQLVGNSAFYIGTIGFMLVVCHLYRIRETLPLNWLIFLGPKLVLVCTLLALSFVLFFVGRVMPSRLPLLSLIALVRAGRATGLWARKALSIVAVLTLCELYALVAVLYEIRRTWRCLNTEPYTTSRARQLGFRLFLYTTGLAYFVLWILLILIVSICPMSFSIAYYYIMLSYDRLPSFYTDNSRVERFLASVYFNPLFSSSLYFILNSITIAIMICNVLIYLPPETPALFAKIVCCLATSRKDVLSNYLCCRDEPRPFFRWGPRQTSHGTVDAPPSIASLPTGQGVTRCDAYPVSCPIEAQVQAPNIMAPVGSSKPVAGTSLDTLTTNDAIMASTNENQLHRAQAGLLKPNGGTPSRDSGTAGALATRIPVLRRYVFSVETMVEQFNLSWLAYVLDPARCSGRFIQSQRFWRDSLELFYDAATDTLGYILEADDRIVLSFRGTRSRRNLQTDMQTRLVPLRFPNGDMDHALYQYLLRCGKYYNRKGARWSPVMHISDTALRLERYLRFRARSDRPRVHEGFLASYLTLCEALERALTQRYQRNPRPVLISGHSLGGALANLAALHLAIHLQLGQDSLMLTTFGSPRVGDLHFARLLDYLVPIHFRVTNAADVVARLPFTGLGGWFACGGAAYAHAGVQVLLNKHGLLRVDPSVVELEFQFRVGAYIEPHLKRGYKRSIEAWAQRSGNDGWQPDLWVFPKKKRMFGLGSGPQEENDIVLDTGEDEIKEDESTSKVHEMIEAEAALEENMDVLANEGEIRNLVRGMTWRVLSQGWLSSS